MNDMKDKTYRLPEAAAILSVHPRTLKRWQRAGKLRLIELPGGQFRVPETEVSRLLGLPHQPTDPDALPFDEPPEPEEV
jgi:excisionase family DNA binding protein